jgi:hypothetical protein
MAKVAQCREISFDCDGEVRADFIIRGRVLRGYILRQLSDS